MEWFERHAKWIERRANRKPVGTYRDVKRALIHVREISWVEENGTVYWFDDEVFTDGIDAYRYAYDADPTAYCYCPCPRLGNYLDEIYYCPGCGCFYNGSWETLKQLRQFIDSDPRPEAVREYAARLIPISSFAIKHHSDYCQTKEAGLQNAMRFLRNRGKMREAIYIECCLNVWKTKQRNQASKLRREMKKAERQQELDEATELYGWGSGRGQFTLNVAKAMLSKGTGLSYLVPSDAAKLYIEHRRLKTLLRRTETETR